MKTPPAPKRIRGPKSGSCLLPMSSSQLGFLLLGLDRHPQDVGLRFGGPDLFDEFVERRQDLGFVVEMEAHPLDLGLVGDIRRINLHHHREAQVPGRRGRLRGGGGRHRAVHRDAVGRQDGLGFQLREDGGLALQAMVDEGPGRPGVDSQLPGHLGRSLLQQLQMPGVEIHLHEDVHRLLRGLEGGDAGVIEDFHPSATSSPPIQTAKTGRAWPCISGATARATPVGSVRAWGDRMITRPESSGASMASCTARR